MASLKSLNKGDVVEVRALQRPPLGVKLVIEAICIMKEVKPKKVSRPLSFAGGMSVRADGYNRSQGTSLG